MSERDKESETIQTETGDDPGAETRKVLSESHRFHRDLLEGRGVEDPELAKALQEHPWDLCRETT